MFRIMFFQPCIPPNTGNAIRLAANTGCQLHLIEPLGFDMEDRLLKRAGLDYHEYADVRRHVSWQAWMEAMRPDAARCFAFSTRGGEGFASTCWQAGDWLVFGNESAGLPAELLAGIAAERRLRLPMRPGQRSLNLSNAVAVVVFEAWRQNGYRGGT